MDSNPNSGMPPEDTNNKGSVRRKRNVPFADIDFGSLCQTVVGNWQNNAWLQLIWTNAAIFNDQVQQYKKLLDTKTQSGGRRPVLTDTLRQLDEKINSSISYIKGYLDEKYGKTVAPSHYAAFGIVRYGNRLAIPAERNRRREALTQLISALKEEGFTDNIYGINFWQAVKNDYDVYLRQALQTDSTVSEKTGHKNKLKKELRKVLNSIILALKAHYPDTWKTELRNWGFQKEKY